ncbi:uncharacterized protein OCT59_021471 [Rhizophagus irregularis]|uniref:uncharacterized protein n=1 Tax=Rhizophagus irregularis TaxID=588596 RepID=UPI00331EE151|nr:hypothetical protein OCT59_021471 [Rhizophagus irregularis]
MDLFIVNSKLENNQYSNEKEFENDVCLIFNNYCSIYDIESEMYHLELKKKQKLNHYIEITDDVFLFALAYNSLISANEPVLQGIFEFSLPLKYRIPELCLVMNKNVRKGNRRFGFVDMFVLGDETNVIIESKYIQLAGLLRDINEKQTKTFSSIELSKLDKIIEKEDEKSLLERKYLQNKFWIEDNIVSVFPFDNNFYKKLFYSKRNYDNWILENIKILKNNNIDISINNKLSIEKYKITGEKTRVITNYIKPKKWYKELQNIITIDGKTLKPEYKTSAVSHFKGYNMAQCEIDRNNILKQLTFIGVWNNRSNDIEIGVLIKTSGIDEQNNLIIGHLNVINNVNHRLLII